MNIIEILQDPNWVWQFQSFFGIEKVQVNEVDSSKGWVPIDASALDYDKNKINKDCKTVTNGIETKKDENTLIYKVNSKFWYKLFKFGSFLGEEVCYAILFSFLVWNVDSLVGRRVFLVGYLTFYIGQALKDLLRWPRPPMPEVVRMEPRFNQEYGMPSTHAMMALSLPFSVVVFTVTKPYWHICVVLGLLSFILVCSCRLYLGMHTLLDILAGLFLSSLILLISIPIIEQSEEYLLTDPLAPLMTLLVTMLSVVLYPQHVYTPSRGDTALLTSSCWGAHTGAWLAWRGGVITDGEHQYSDHTLPMMVVMSAFRQFTGLLILALIYIVWKPFSKHLSSFLVGSNMKTLSQQEFLLTNKRKIFVDLFSKVTTFGLMGFSLTTVVPELHRYLGCDRPNYWTETFSVS